MARQRRKHNIDRQAAHSAAWRFIHDNSLSLTFAALFFICLVGQDITGTYLHADVHGGMAIGYWAYLKSPTFLEGVLVNWQAAILQLMCLITFGTFLYQKGATHSRSPQHRAHRHHGLKKLGAWTYGNSLFLAFALLFLAIFVLHGYFGWRDYNSERGLMRLPPLSLGDFIVSAKFWFTTLQTWEAEFFAISFYMVLSIFLRQEGSPESKPLNSSDKETGEANK